MANIHSERPHVPPSEGIFVGGSVSGLCAGIVMGAVGMLYNWAVGAGFWMPLRQVAASFLGVSALISGPGSPLLGMMLHLCVSAFWGIVFATIISRSTPPRQAFLGGILYGAAVWFVMTFGALPSLDLTMLSRVRLMPGAWFFEHLVYGACLAVTPYFRRRFAEKPVLLRRRARRVIEPAQL